MHQYFSPIHSLPLRLQPRLTPTIFNILTSYKFKNIYNIFYAFHSLLTRPLVPLMCLKNDFPPPQSSKYFFTVLFFSFSGSLKRIMEQSYHPHPLVSREGNFLWKIVKGMEGVKKFPNPRLDTPRFGKLYSPFKLFNPPATRLRFSERCHWWGVIRDQMQWGSIVVHFKHCFFIILGFLAI